MSGSLKVNISLSHPTIPTDADIQNSYYALLDVTPSQENDAAAERAPLNIVFLVDSSASMHHLQLTELEQEYWMGLALSRDDVRRGTADDRDAVYWSGQTLLEMTDTVKKPITVVADALRTCIDGILPTDSVSVVVFADTAETVFDAEQFRSNRQDSLNRLDDMRDDKLSGSIGTSTRLSAGLKSASNLLGNFAKMGGINRLVIISDGIVQDSASAIHELEDLQTQGFAITTVGVGDEFDEEFLTRIADTSRGQYYYAPTLAEVTKCLTGEVSVLQHTSITDLYIAVKGTNGTFIQDIAMVRPSMSIFDEVFTEGDWTSARVGDVSSSILTTLLVQYLPVHVHEGLQAIAEIQLTWSNAGDSFTADKGSQNIVVNGLFSSDPIDRFKENPAVVDIADRYTVFKLEREAQRAKERGDIDSAREKYGAATRKLATMGETELAQDIENEMATLGTAQSDPAAAKRLKSTTRRLATQGYTLPTDAAK